ncbi:hypothetical protein D3C85_740450 [compost metagenome]
MPSCQITAISEQPTTSRVLRRQRVYSRMMQKALSTAMAKNIITWIRPSIRSPISLAKPITRILILPLPSASPWRTLAPANS